MSKKRESLSAHRFGRAAAGGSDLWPVCCRGADPRNQTQMITMLALLASQVAQRLGEDYRVLLLAMAAAGPINSNSIVVDVGKIRKEGQS